MSPLDQRTRIRMLAICLSRASRAARARRSMMIASLARSSAKSARFSIFVSWSLKCRVSFCSARWRTPQNWDRALVTCPTSSVHSAFERFSPNCCRPWRAPRAIAESLPSVCYSRASDIASSNPSLDPPPDSREKRKWVGTSERRGQRAVDGEARKGRDSV